MNAFILHYFTCGYTEVKSVHLNSANKKVVGIDWVYFPEFVPTTDTKRCFTTMSDTTANPMNHTF